MKPSPCWRSGMAQNVYDDPGFFESNSQLARSTQ